MIKWNGRQVFVGSLCIAACGFMHVTGFAAGITRAQEVGVVDPHQSRAWARGAIAHAQQMRRYKDLDAGGQPTPPMIPKFELDADPTGTIGTFQPGVATITSNNAFFQNLGTNGRTCLTCHQPATGWSVSAASVRARFQASGGRNPIFRLVDGATCPSDSVSTPAAKATAYKLLLSKGLIRIGIPLPTSSEFLVSHVEDPYGCTTQKSG